MAQKTFSTSDALTKKVYDETLFRDVEKQIYFKRFMGSTQDSLVYVKSSLEKEGGDRITFPIRYRLTGTGRTEGQQLEGNEEAMSTADYSLTLGEVRHATRWKGGIDLQRIPWNVADEAKAAIATWGSEKIDAMCFAALYATANKVWYREASAGALTSTTSFATAVSALSNVANQKITPAFISQLRVLAKTGNNRAVPPLRPIRVDGKDHYVLLVSEDVGYDLKVDTTYAQAQREAMERGKDNPLFTGALGVWDNVVIHTHESVTTGGTTYPYSYGTLMGAQALCFAWGKRPRTIFKSFDYDHESGAAWEAICAAGKPVFSSADYGSLNVVLTRTNVSGV
jgi:N4-gp56 family major capsid protein